MNAIKKSKKKMLKAVFAQNVNTAKGDHDYEYYGKILKDKGGCRYYRYEINAIEAVFESLCIDGNPPEYGRLARECQSSVGGYEDYYNGQNNPEPIKSECDEAVYYLYPYLVRRFKLIELLSRVPGLEISDIGCNNLYEPISFSFKYVGIELYFCIFEEHRDKPLNSGGLEYDLNCISFNRSESGVSVEMDTMMAVDDAKIGEVIHWTNYQHTLMNYKEPSSDYSELIFSIKELSCSYNNIKIYDHRHINFIVNEINRLLCLRSLPRKSDSVNCSLPSQTAVTLDDDDDFFRF